jgi:transcriptional regulator with XRE-family HTH domain
MDIQRLLARNMRRLRKEYGWSQEHLAFEAGLHRTYISGVERCVRNPTMTGLAKIAAGLKVSPSKLLEE